MKFRSCVTAKMMGEIDRRAQEEYGISQAVLMENAGCEVARVIVSDNFPFKKERVAIFCGKGNNGGDGFVAARHLLFFDPKELIIYVFSQGGTKPGAAQDNLNILLKMGVKVRPIRDFLDLPSGKRKFTIAIDAIFGINFRGKLPEECDSVGKILNSSNIKVYAVDIPSGLNAANGISCVNTPRAYKTVTFGLTKSGLLTQNGRRVAGEIVVRNIGFPPELLKIN